MKYALAIAVFLFAGYAQAQCPDGKCAATAIRLIPIPAPEQIPVMPKPIYPYCDKCPCVDGKANDCGIGDACRCYQPVQFRFRLFARRSGRR